MSGNILRAKSSQAFAKHVLQEEMLSMNTAAVKSSFSIPIKKELQDTERVLFFSCLKIHKKMK